MTTKTLNLIIVLSAFFVVFLPFTGDAYKKTNALFKRITVRGWIIIVFSILGGWASVQKDQLAEDKNKIEKIATDKELAHRDSTAEKKRIESNREIVGAFSDALGKWGYKLDSQSNAIVRFVRDSNLNEDEPYIEMYKNGITGLKYDRKDSLYFSFGVHNPKPHTIAYNVRVSVDFIIQSNGKFVSGAQITDAFPTHPSVAPLTHADKEEAFGINGYGNFKVDTIFLKAKLYCTNYSKKIIRTREEFDIIIISQMIWAEYDYNMNEPLYDYLRAIKLYP